MAPESRAALQQGKGALKGERPSMEAARGVCSCERRLDSPTFMSEEFQDVLSPNVCHTKSIQSADMMICLADAPETCQHVVNLGGTWFCRHPDRLTFETPAQISPGLA
jgi:hypothetical protein